MRPWARLLAKDYELLRAFRFLTRGLGKHETGSNDTALSGESIDCGRPRISRSGSQDVLDADHFKPSTRYSVERARS
jgi:hypothetical protein